MPAQVGDICFAPVLPKEAGGLPVWAVVVCKFEQHALIKTCTWHTQWWIKRSIYIYPALLFRSRVCLAMAPAPFCVFFLMILVTVRGVVDEPVEDYYTYAFETLVSAVFILAGFNCYLLLQKGSSCKSTPPKPG